MGSGMIQIEVYGTQDIFLTGSPQITFFKMVYRRHTNFAIVPIHQDFFGSINFNSELTCVLEKIGDLVHKMYLEIELPRVYLEKNPSNWSNDLQNATVQKNIINEYYNLVFNYINADTDIIRKLTLLCRTNNIPFSQIEATMVNPIFLTDLINSKQALVDYISTNANFNQIIELADQKFYLLQEINIIDITAQFNYIITTINNAGVLNTSDVNDQLKRTECLRVIYSMLYPQLQRFYLPAYTLMVEKNKIYNEFINSTYTEAYRCAWVEEIGHAIIDYLEIKIGAELIDKHTGDWMIIMNKLFQSEYQKDNYNKLIGDIVELRTFDSNAKPAYKLVIPLQFWFCRFAGLALPLVALRYHDVTFTLKIKDLSKLFYVENDPNLLDMANIQNLYNINLISASFIVDYIHLDSDERKRFAQSTHEYLIEQVQYREIPDILGQKYIARVAFANPTKFIIWYAQPNYYRDNPTGRNKCQWNNFGTEVDKSGYTMDRTFIRLNSYDRTDNNQSVLYTNYVQPYNYFRTDPTDGFNVYSFAIKPLEHQPSSTCNLSRIDELGIDMDFTDKFVAMINSTPVENIGPGATINVYVYNYTIIRFLSGMCGLAFKTSN